MNKVGVAYLYRRLDGRGFVPVRPYGRRFDEAALRFFARRQHFALPSLMDGGRVAHFERWAARSNRLVFRLDAAKYYDRRHWDRVVGYYDLNGMRFGLLNFQRE